MELQLKQRIIGAVVIFTLLIIFLPMLLENNNNPQKVEELLVSPDVSDNHIDSDIKAKMELLKQKLIDSKLQNKFNKSNESIITKSTTIAKAINTKNEPQPLPQPELDSQSDSQSDTQLESKLAPASAIDSKPKVAQKSEVVVETLNQIEPKIDSKQKLTVTNINIKKDNKIITNTDGTLNKSEVYAIKIVNTKDEKHANQLKDLLLSMGYPAYVKYTKTKGIMGNDNGEYLVFVGPDLELKYIKELAKRIVNETDYTAEIIVHDKSWVSA